MDYSARYELLDKLGAGSYAAVYRARDKELGREVAIKVIHQQYREEPKLLDRYWQEAQLLASMQHPNIITVYDVVRDRGWLVMELMMANLGQRLDGKQMDLRSLRTTLAHCLRALKYLHARGVIHGDIKPSNMMIDSRKRIKIGDFGLARRVSDEDGSLLKGTTKYIAPEVVSDDFGEVGPQSDLYSLGFSAYELICGTENFENLFPGLSAFGKDKQLAWMMWHAAPDRKLPEISRVLEGVPEDLAHVIQRLIEKDPKKRYPSADAALADLKVDQTIIKEVKPETVEAKPEQPNKSRIYIAIAAFVMSALVSIGVLFMPQQGGQTNKPATRKMGVIRQISLDDRLLVIDDPDTGIPEEYKLSQKPKLYLESEKKNILLRELLVGDRVAVDIKEDSSGNKFYELIISRAVQSTGTLQSIMLAEQKLIASIEEGPFRGNLTLKVPEKVQFQLNGSPVNFQDLLVGDVATFEHFIPPAGKGDRILDKVNVLRQMSTRGYIQSLNKNDLTLLLRYGKGSTKTTLQKKIAKDCKVLLKGGNDLTLDDLQVEDRIEISYRELVEEITVIRAPQKFEGIVTEVDREANKLTVKNGQAELKTFSLAENGEVTLQFDRVNLADLRPFDNVEVLYQEGADPLQATAIDTTRAVKADRWAVIIGVEKYQDKSLTPLSHALIDARYLQDVLITRYGFNKDRIKLMLNPNKKEMLSGFKQILEYAKPQFQVIVYFNGHSYLSPDDKPYLAPADFQFDNMPDTGISLEEFTNMLESSSAQQKIFLFDGTQAGFGKDLDRQPSGKTQFGKFQLPRTTTEIMVSCDDGQRGYPLLEKQRGLFVQAIGDAYSGPADTNFDLNVTAEELRTFMVKHAPDLKAQDAGVQTPVLLPK